MAAPFNQILFKAEDAVAIRVATATLPGSPVIHKGGGTGDEVLPKIIVVAESATEREPRFKRNYSVTVGVHVVTSMDDSTRADRIALAGAVGDILSTDALAADLSGDVADFKVFGAMMEKQSQAVIERTHVYSFELLLACAGSDV